MGLFNSDFQAGGHAAPIINAATKEQADQSWESARDALAQQQALAQALQGQGTQGMGYQTQLGQALSQQMQGQGPNPAQAMLAQNTAANTANQAALMAGQRGASSNAGLIARQAGREGGAIQQAAVGQAATLQAQQQLAAQQQLQALAGTQIGQNQQSTGAYNQAAQGEQANILNAINGQNNANVAMQSNMNNVNSAIAQSNNAQTAGLAGGLLNAGGAAMGAFFAQGGLVKENQKLAQVPQADRFNMPEHIKGMAEIYHPDHVQKMAYGGVMSPGMAQINEGSPYAANIQPSFNTAGLSAAIADKVSKDKEDKPDSDEVGGSLGGGGGPLYAASFAPVMAKGGAVPGEPKVDHNTTKNDVVPALLTPKEIVLPLSVTQAEDAPEKAKSFVAAIIEKNGGGSKDHEDDFKKALKEAMAQRKKK